MINISTRNLFVRAGFDASGMLSGTRQANNALRQFGKNANKQMSSLSNTVSSSMSKIGKLLAGAFAVGAIVNFGKEATKAFSDSSVASAKLEKVMKNTMNATSEHIEGIKKLIADQELGGVIGGDVQFAGAQELGTYLTEAESLKKIIPIMNDMAAQQFGLEATAESVTNIATMLGKVMNGQVGALSRYGYSFTKAQEKILKFGTEAERAAVLVEVVGDSVGGMNAALLQTPAGQIRQLQFALDGVKSAIGEGIMSAVQAALPALNAMAKVLLKVAQAFSAFMQAIFGKTIKMQDTQISGTQDQVSAVESLGDAADDAGESAKKAGKKAKGALASFDELNQLSSTSDSSSGSSGGSGLDNMGGAVAVDLGETVEQTDKLTTMFDVVIAQLTKMKELFSSGFKIGFETANLDALNSAIANIKTGFMNLFNDGTILNSFINMLDKLAFNLGAISGSFGSVGVTLTSNLIGGVANYLNENSQYIKDRIISIFDVIGEISTISENFSVAFADIFSVFSGQAAQNITANIIEMFSNAFLGTLDIAVKLGRDVLTAFTSPIVENKELIKSALQGTLASIESITGSISNFITNTFETIGQTYDSHVKPAFENITTALTNLMSNLLENYNAYILPVIDGIAAKLQTLFASYIQPNVDLIITSIGRVIKASSKILNEVIEPMVEDLNNLLGPAIGFVVKKVSDFAIKLTGKLFKALGDVADKIADVCDWLSEHKLATEIIITTLGSLATAIGIVTVAMNLGAIAQGLITTATTLWNVAAGIGASVTGAFGAAMAILTSPITLVVLAITAVIAVVVLLIRHWDDVKEIAAKCWDSIKNTWHKVSEWFDTTVVQPVAKFFSGLWNGIKESASTAWQNVCNAWKSAGQWFSTTIIAPIINLFNTLKTTIANVGTLAWNGLKSTWNGATNWFKNTIITPIGNAFSTMWNGVKTTCSNVFNSIKSVVKAPLNAVIGMVNTVLKGVNSVTGTLSKLPGVNISTIPQIPKLAKGGIIDNPTIAMVGEAGREAVVPLENNTGWTNEVASLLANALMPFMGVGNNGNSGQNVSLEMDGTTFARTATPYVIKEMKRLGFV